MDHLGPLGSHCRGNAWGMVELGSKFLSGSLPSKQSLSGESPVGKAWALDLDYCAWLLFPASLLSGPLHLEMSLTFSFPISEMDSVTPIVKGYVKTMSVSIINLILTLPPNLCAKSPWIHLNTLPLLYWSYSFLTTFIKVCFLHYVVSSLRKGLCLMHVCISVLSAVPPLC